ncbi:LysR family transcriptional regulator [Paraburkholderia sacchari]|uniref:LysR family transcriptional regulator n=1 Tax=Paraburkholderia sacchari TaxID=159450 RepID=UPI0005425336|nr:LysR family transcriptional regulator [Paraburkholderia sacchari]NLP63042.1 LysR family transcriptional regulator [Paraburkholderia sacchari]
MLPRVDEEITFRKLEVLLAFMQCGNLAKAAETLDISTVSVHRALHSLEKGLRCTLFRHEGRSLTPTDAAQVLAEVAAEVIKTMIDGIRATREAAGYGSEHLKIGSLYSLTIRAVPEIVTVIKSRRPDLQAELILGSNADLLDKLKRGTIDASLMAVPSHDSEIESIELFEDEIFFAAPIGSAYGQCDAIDLRQCRDEPFVSLSEGFATSEDFLEAFRIADFTPNVVMKVSDIFSLINLVSGGVGYTLLPGRVRDLFAHKIMLIPLSARYDMRQTIGLSFLRRRERDPNLLALATVCRLTIKGQPAS